METILTEIEAVTLYINNNIYHSDAYDKATADKRFKAINNAKRQLLTTFKHLYPNETIPIEDIAEQAIWLMRINDLMLNAEQGAGSINLDGISITFKDAPRAIAPFLARKYGVSASGTKKVGRYRVLRRDTYRRGCNDGCIHF